MCRLLLVQSRHEIDPTDYLAPFADACRHSREYQGHGWGIASLRRAGPERWDRYRNLTPIWEDDVTQFQPTRVFLAHARSAFRDEDIVLENNMPFVTEPWTFAFNGELRGVRVRAEGRTGAARIWHLIQRARATGVTTMKEAVERVVGVLERQSEYVRAINVFMTDGSEVIVHSTHNESPDYFTLQQFTTHDGSVKVASSEPIDLPLIAGDSSPSPLAWAPIANRTTVAW